MGGSSRRMCYDCRRLWHVGDRKQMDSAPRVFSIGHSNHDLAALVGLLRQAGVAAVADVRSAASA